MPRALVIGVNGQDGAYLAEHLLGQGVTVTGIGRQPAPRHVAAQPGFAYRQLDLAAPGDLPRLLAETAADEIYYLAAVHGAAGFAYEAEWQAALQVNLGSLQLCLEHLRRHAPVCRLLYASSVKSFGEPPPPVVSETTPRASHCLYAITKNAATDLIGYYRARHDLRASVLFLFNHESPRRPAHYFMPRLVELLARALRGEPPGPALRSLDFACDWGSSLEYMQLARALLARPDNQDYVLATGRTWTGRDFTEALFARAGLDWQDHVQLEEPPGTRSFPTCQADISRLRAVLGAGPQVSALDVAAWILEVNHGLRLTQASTMSAKAACR